MSSDAAPRDAFQVRNLEPSDLDAMVVFEGDETAAVRVAELLVASLATSSLGLPPPRLDLDLRPEGRGGALKASASSGR